MNSNKKLIIAIVGVSTLLLVIVLVSFGVLAAILIRNSKNSNKAPLTETNASTSLSNISLDNSSGRLKISTSTGKIDLYTDESIGAGWKNNVDKPEEGDFQYYNEEYDCSFSFFINKEDIYYAPQSYNQSNIDSVIEEDGKHNDISGTLSSIKYIDDLKVKKKGSSNFNDGYSLPRMQYSGIYHDNVPYKLQTSAISNGTEAISIVNECADSAPNDVREEINTYLSKIEIETR